MTLIPAPNRMTGPGGVRSLFERFARKFIFEIFRFQEGSAEKLALALVGC
ncbi:hypothetical protein J2Y63_006614 [Shinella sp. BE166]